jgi:hypothetical protein
LNLHPRNPWKELSEKQPVYISRLMTGRQLSPEQELSFSRQSAWLTSGIGEVTPLSTMEGFPHVNARLQETPFKRYPACENSYRAFIRTKNADFLRRPAAADTTVCVRRRFCSVALKLPYQAD